ncbi:MAG: Alpha/Beta hydrolase protein [Lentinula lateritia]|uniref:Alpha/Beta hydrolase protein n=1 Tax=Lentinula lateritia TaxID=40482 RepID=A0ABQ8VU18_9AGAR|nr:MAG: Alpha/Beta hydrolase protein [Lentinula lateritia]KAJ4499877.1 Alpha/Beta hydrolase protein [Lentinula lateritia]
MPFVDIYSKDDFASIFYITNTEYDCVGGFDPEKPTILMLHPTTLDSSWLTEQFSDPRLGSNFNLIAFDMRVCGQSTCRANGKHDLWVEAADIAMCCQELHLPPCHIFACETLAVNSALRFAILFPELCLSLTLCNVPAPTEMKWVFNAYDEMMQTWCYTEDLESLEHVSMELTRFIVGSECDPDLRDDLIEYWEIEMPPFRRTRIVEQLGVIMNRTPLKSYMLKEVTQPVLIIQGERNEVSPLKYAERLVADLVNAEGGAILYEVKGGVGALNVVPGTASITNQVFSKFVLRLPHHRSDLLPSPTPKEERMSVALEKLAQLMGDSAITLRDPLSPMSFSCLTPEVVKGQEDSLKLYRKGEGAAFNPCGPNGKPIRKFSETRKQHWFSGEKDGISYASSSLTKNGKQEAEPYERLLPLPQSEPVTGDLAHQGRLRRATISPSSVDKHVIKGSMAKVVNSNTPNSFQRLLK